MAVVPAAEEAVVVMSLDGYARPLSLLVGLPEARAVVNAAGATRGRRPGTLATWGNTLKVRLTRCAQRTNCSQVHGTLGGSKTKSCDVMLRLAGEDTGLVGKASYLTTCSRTHVASAGPRRYCPACGHHTAGWRHLLRPHRAGGAATAGSQRAAINHPTHRAWRPGAME